MSNSIEKQISKGIQIIAILMMVFHHTQFIGSMCKICVSLFAFGTGYALAHKNLTL